MRVAKVGHAIPTLIGVVILLLRYEIDRFLGDPGSVMIFCRDIPPATAGQFLAAGWLEPLPVVFTRIFQEHFVVQTGVACNIMSPSANPDIVKACIRAIEIAEEVVIWVFSSRNMLFFMSGWHKYSSSAKSRFFLASMHNVDPKFSFGKK